VLVHGAAGGVGSAAVQLAKAAGATVIAVVGSAGKVETARSQGAHIVIDSSADDFVARVLAETNGAGADVVFDPVGGETYSRSTKCIAFEGRIVVVGFAAGDIQTARLNHALVKNYSILGLHAGLYLTRKPAVAREAHRALLDLIAAGHVHPFVSRRVTLEEIPGALEDLAGGSTVGRIVWTPELEEHHH
jgi:NADPH2:quinone reductase